MDNLTSEELIDIWMTAGYTLEESNKLVEDSQINTIDVGISTEEACASMKEAMDRYKKYRIIGY